MKERGFDDEVTMKRWTRDDRRVWRNILLGVALLAACVDPTPVFGPVGPALLAKGSSAGGGGGGKVSVTSADPDTVSIDTTVTIAIYGSGFSPGAKVEYILNSQVSQKMVATNVEFVSSSRLNTETTVAADAPLGSYDIAVTSNGKRGIGAEQVEVVARAVALEEPDGSVTSVAYDVNSTGVIVGSVTDAAGVKYAVRWTPADRTWSSEVLARGAALAVNADGDVLRSDADGATARWYVHTGSGTIVEVPGANTPSYDMHLADDGTIAGVTRDGSGVWFSAYWLRTGPASWSDPIPLPTASGYRIGTPLGISRDGSWIVGTFGLIADPSGEWAGSWHRSGNGWLTPVMLGRGAPLAVNSAGVAAGLQSEDVCSWGYCYTGGVVWPAAGVTAAQLNPAGHRDGMPYSRPMSINESGKVAGMALVPVSSKKRAVQRRLGVVWHSWDAPPMPLIPPHGMSGDPTFDAWQISDGGLVIGTISVSGVGTGSHAFVWILP